MVTLLHPHTQYTRREVDSSAFTSLIAVIAIGLVLTFAFSVFRAIPGGNYDMGTSGMINVNLGANQ